MALYITNKMAIVIELLTKAHDCCIAIYNNPHFSPQIYLTSQASIIRYDTNTPIRAALYRMYNGKYELLAHHIMNPNDIWEIRFEDIVCTSLMICSNIDTSPYIPIL